MSYLTYEEYRSYGGNLEGTAFQRLEFKAEKKIDNETFGRLKKEAEISETVKRLIFELIGIFNNADYSSEDFAPTPTSESNDGYSVSYASNSFITADMVDDKANELIAEYLSEEKDSKGTPLLYCGY